MPSKKERCFYAQDKRGPSCDGCDHNMDCVVNRKLIKAREENGTLREDRDRLRAYLHDVNSRTS
jgi:hypothetical protein